MKVFFQEVVNELKRVTWPTRSEVVGSVKVVLVGMLILGLFVGVLDFIFSKGMAALFSI